MFDFSKYPYDLKNNAQVIGGEPMILHCHHYNTYLQRSILDADYVDSKLFLIGAAAEVAYGQLSQVLPQYPEAQRRKVVEEFYRLCGFGTLDLSQLGEKGGEVRTANSHYSMGWKAKFGASKTPVVYFTSGFLAGAWAALYGKPLNQVSADQSTCISMGASHDVFTVKNEPSNFAQFPQKQELKFTAAGADAQVDTNVDRKGITAAISGMPIAGNTQGHIPAFGVYLTRMYADYYNRISFELERAMIEKAGQQGKDAAANLLIEAAHVCAFYTFGGIMSSTEWDGMIRPACKTKEDWVSAMTAVVNALGWGEWKVMDLSPAKAKFHLYNDYESKGYNRMYGKSSAPVNYLALGGAAGLMDLVYLGNIETKPALTPAFYDKLFRSANSYKAKITQSAAMGAPFTVIEVSL